MDPPPMQVVGTCEAGTIVFTGGSRNTSPRRCGRADVTRVLLVAVVRVVVQSGVLWCQWEVVV